MIPRLLFVSALLFLGSCSQKQEPAIELAEAHQKFISVCREEFELTPILKPVGNTLWIYLPLKESFISSQAGKDKAAKSSTFDMKADMRYIDGRFDGKDFYIPYDIGKKREYHVTPGYTSTMSENFSKLQQNLLLAVQKAYFNSQDPPQIIALIIADITSGIEVETLMYFDDLKQSMSIFQTLPQEESSKRFVSEIRGDKSIIADETGKHLPNRAITMGEFLAKQIVQRVNFKYTQSAFPPADDTPGEIAKIAQEAFEVYKFRDFDAVILEDLATGKKFRWK